MKDFMIYAKRKLTINRRLLLMYIVVYALWGILMNWFGTITEIARFTSWWQIITVYILYMIPISLLLRGLPFYQQYAYGLVAMGLLEFSGYALETSFAYPENIIDKAFNIRNFTLGMALFFALYFPLGNWFVQKINKSIDRLKL